VSSKTGSADDAHVQGGLAPGVPGSRPAARLRRAPAAARAPRHLRRLHEFQEANGLSAQGGEAAWIRSERQLIDYLEHPSVRRIRRASSESDIDVRVSEFAVPGHVEDSALLVAGEPIAQRAGGPAGLD